MSMLVLLVFLTGAVLGMKFKVFVLAPAMGLAAIAGFATGMIRGDSLHAILLACTLTLIALQMGYLGGILTRYAMTLARNSSRRKASLHLEST
jgi:hypothetical protein